MRKTSLTLILFLLLLPGLFPAHAADGPTHVRFAHLAPTLDAIDIYAGGQVVVKGLKYRDVSDFVTFDGEQVQIVLVAAGGKPSDSLLDGPAVVVFGADSGGSFTVAIAGALKDHTLEVVKLPGEARTAGGTPGSVTVGTITITGAYARATTSAPAMGAPATQAVSGGMGGMDMGGAATAAATKAVTVGDMPMGAVSAAYMVIENTADQTDRLVSISADVAGDAQLHQTVITNDIAQMVPVTGGLTIPAHSRAELKPGGYHIMLMNLKKDLAPGDMFSMSLGFESGIKVTLQVPVTAP